MSLSRFLKNCGKLLPSARPSGLLLLATALAAQPSGRVPGPYDPHHLVPPVITATGPQLKALGPLLPIPGGIGASLYVQQNQIPITKIIGNTQYQILYQWEKNHEPFPGPAGLPSRTSTSSKGEH